ncbi:cef [Aeromonas phage 31]|uniref:Cef n=2 Tax=Biquartavirus TaxID=1912143 RepID=Q56EZ6_9CAUD|nr:cef modifier of supressor tRNAs [Aeromonas phage 31]APU00910.1 modifier of suppressor tRNAs [Aeromonas phage 31.2]APU02068.1 modifier of suppressor tRNAs [Aeromonas phage Riv-10]APU02317.1 modifier of suppressor tRNAs [Aeromonas phage SW69-9]UYD59576.1 hypothetical protein JNMOADIG_00047 [Aeromonas phage avDM5]UYD60450.1 hypothetical protein NPHMPGLK_00115 [Aeromonas phage avDM2]
MRISKDFFLDVMFTNQFNVVEKSHEEHLVYTTVLYVFDGNTRIAVLERVITKDGSEYKLVEGVYENLKGRL